jgi:predicted KAP-like P-loop ATPase
MNHIEGDRALAASGIDRVGFQSVARRLAAALSSHASDGGLVVGIEGKWGSGKSSLLNLIERELRELPEKDRPTIINFRPWLVGSRDSLLLRLFDEFSTGIDRFQAEQGDTSSIDKKKVIQVAEDMRAFAFAVSKFGAFIEVAGEYSANPAVKWGGKAIKSFSEMFKKEGGEPSLVQKKDKLWSDLTVTNTYQP